MTGPRIQLVHGLPTQGSSATVAVDRFGWRLLGGNQRELGRSFDSFDDVVAARASARLLQAAADRVVVAVLVDPVTGLWSWRLRLGEFEVIASSRGYQRRRECESNVACAVLALATAALVPEVLVLPSRAGRGASSGRTARVHLPGTLCS